MPRLGFPALVVATSFGALLSFSGASHAAPDEARDPHVELVAPKGCPSTNAFLDAVRARVQAGPHTNIAFAVEITHDAKGFHGKLSSLEDHRVIREVRAPVCADAMNALALAAATALLPSEESTPIEASVPPPSVPSEPIEIVEPPPPPPDPIMFSAGFGPMGVAGYGPTPSVGAQLYAQIAVGNAEVRVGGVFALTPKVTLGEGASSDRISFSWQGARFDLCPYAFSFAKGAWQISPCVRMEMGAVQSNPSADTTNSEDDTRGWFALGLSAHARWAFRPPFFLELEVWGSAPFDRDRFYLLPDVEVFEVPAFAGGVTISTGFFFSRRK